MNDTSGQTKICPILSTAKTSECVGERCISYTKRRRVTNVETHGYACSEIEYDDFPFCNALNAWLDNTSSTTIKDHIEEKGIFLSDSEENYGDNKSNWKEK